MVEKEGRKGKKDQKHFFLASVILLFTMLSMPAVLFSASKNSGDRTWSFIVKVNGVELTQDRFDAEMSRRITVIKNEIPPGRFQQIEEVLKKQIVDDFLIRTILFQEVKKRGIAVTDEEVFEALDRMKAGLPRGINLDDLLKNNNMTADQFREEITLAVKINKLLMSQPRVKEKPTEKEIATYYNENKDKFRVQEKVLDLDENLKNEISSFLSQQRKQDAYLGMVKKLRARATILVPGK